MAKTTPSLRVLENHGSAADHIYNHEWQNTPLGSADHWSGDLKVTVGIIMNSPFPKLLCWGEKLTCIYNVAYFQQVISGRKQHDVLGQPLSESLPALWKKFSARLPDYFGNSQSTQVELKTIQTDLDGQSVEVVYICNPVHGADGQIKGVLFTVRTETKSDGIEKNGTHLIRQMMKEAPVGLLTLAGSDFEVTMVNATFLQLTGKDESNILHKPLFEVYPLIRDKFQPILEQVMRSGESFYGEEIPIAASFGQKERILYLNIVIQPLRSNDGEMSIAAVIVDTTKMAEEKQLLKRKEELFKKMVSRSRIGTIILKGKNHIVEFASDTIFRDFFKRNPEQSVGHPLKELLPELSDQEFIKDLTYVHKTGAIVHKKEMMIVLENTKARRELFFDYDMAPIWDEELATNAVMVSMSDVTEHVHIRAREKESQQRLEMALEAGGLALWEMDLPPYRMSYSAHLAEMLGLEDPQHTNIETFENLVHPDHRPQLALAHKAAIETGTLFFEGKFLRPGGDFGWLRIRGKVFYDDNQVPVKMVGSTRDVTQEKKKQLALQRREYRLRHLIMEAPVAIGILRGPDYKVELINDVAISLLGKTRKELEGKPVLSVMKEVDSGIAKGLLDEVYYEDRTISGTEYPVRFLRNGKLEKIYVHFEYDPLKNSEGKTIGIIVVGFDVTHQVLSRKKIEENEMRFRLLANTAPNFVCSLTDDGKINFINQTFQWYSGYNLEDLQKNSVFEFVHPDDADKARSKWEKSFMTGTEYIDEHRIRRKDGAYRWFLTRAIPERENSGRTGGWIATSTDIQEIKEQDLQKDYFITRASHELKTPMTSLKGYIQILQSMNQNSSDSMLVHSLERMNLQVDKLTRLIDDLLDTTRLSQEGLHLEKSRFNLCKLIDEIIEDLSPLSDCHVEFDDTNCDVTIDGDREKLSQVITNLLTNAIKYSPGSAHVWITSKRHGNVLTLYVIDHGIGIDKAAQQKIFERFYRVSGKNEDTYPGFGIGLYIANEILKLHDSFLHVDSEPGRGSTFYFNLVIEPPDASQSGE